MNDRLRFVAAFAGPPPATLWVPVALCATGVAAVLHPVAAPLAGGAVAATVTWWARLGRHSTHSVADQARLLAYAAQFRPHLLNRLYGKLHLRGRREWSYNRDIQALELARDWAGAPGHSRHDIARLMLALSDDTVRALFVRQQSCDCHTPEGDRDSAAKLTAIVEAAARLDDTGHAIAERLLSDDMDLTGVDAAQAAVTLSARLDDAGRAIVERLLADGTDLDAASVVQAAAALSAPETLDTR